MITLRNPHSVRAAMEQRPADILRLFEGVEQRHALLGAWERTFETARRIGIPIQPDTSEGREGPGSVLRPKPLASLEKTFSGQAVGSGKGVWVLLDGIESPWNAGTIARTCAFFGVRGLILSRPLSDRELALAYEAACGGMEFVSLAIEEDLDRVFRITKGAGISILGTDSSARLALESVPADRPWLLILGNEEAGISPVSRSACDLLCRIPGSGWEACLNVAVAAGVFLAKLAADDPI